MALADVATLADDVAFQAKTKASMVRTALSLGGNTAVNDERTTLATQILRDPDSFAVAVAYDAAAAANGVAPTTDAAVNTLVTDVLIALARR